MDNRKIKVDGVEVSCYADGSVDWPRKPNGRMSQTFGSDTNRGYKVIHINGKQKQVHLLIAQAFDGEFGEDLQVDHINGEGFDNRPKNLRMATPAQNQQAFRKKMDGCSSKYRGVSWSPKSAKWGAYIKIQGKKKHVGFFDSEDQAAHARDAVAIENGFLPQSLNFTGTINQ